MGQTIVFDTLAYAKKQDILRLEIKIAESKTDIIRWVAAMLVAQAAIVATLVKLL